MTKALPTLKYIALELLLVFVLVFTVNNYIGVNRHRIWADGAGYYDYLPSIFIYHDIDRHKTPYTPGTEKYKRIEKEGNYVNYKGYKVNKYPVGTALLIAPFFLINQYFEDANATGYEESFQNCVYYAAVFYLFFALLYFKKILKLYNIKKWTIFFMQLLLVMATSVIHYTVSEPSFSHIYSLFAICGFIYYTKAYFTKNNVTYILYAAVFFGLIFLIRNINILLLFFIPFLAETGILLKQGVQNLIKKPGVLIKAGGLFIAVVCIQCLLWYIQTNKLLIYSYQKEGFDFTKPELFNILFSYTKGLFVYTPVLLLSLLGLITLGFKKQYYLLISWLVFFAGLTYILSSWWIWSYGASYGSRVYIEYYPVFFILFAILFDSVKPLVKVGIVALSLLAIPVNIIQTYQYKEYILHWDQMNEDRYWKVFLKTHEKYKGVLWKRKYNYAEYDTLQSYSLGDIPMNDTFPKTVFKISGSTINGLDKTSIIQVSFENRFDEGGTNRITLAITDTANNSESYFGRSYFIHFPEQEYGLLQTGFFNFEFTPLKNTPNQQLSLIIDGPKDTSALKNMKVYFLGKK